MPNTTGPLIEHLPAIFHPSEKLKTLLAIFESVFFGSGEHALEGEIEGIAQLFDAFATPDEFLPWLARWVALGHLQEVPEQNQRTLIARSIELFAIRGTKTYLEEILAFYIPENAIVDIEDQEFAGLRVTVDISKAPRVGKNTWLGDDRPFWFVVKINMPEPSGRHETQESIKAKWINQIHGAIDLAKPAHTSYRLEWVFGKSNQLRVT